MSPIQTYHLDNLLIIDDEEQNRTAAKLALPKANIATCTSEALDFISKIDYDCIITDMQMEERYSGLKIVEKSLERKTPVFVLSNIGPGHNGTIVELAPNTNLAIGFLESYDAKKDPKIWELAFKRAEEQQHYIHSVMMGRKYPGYKNEHLDRNIIVLVFTPGITELNQNDKLKLLDYINNGWR